MDADADPKASSSAACEDKLVNHNEWNVERGTKTYKSTDGRSRVVSSKKSNRSTIQKSSSDASVNLSALRADLRKR
jgi:hypothetical protein